MAEHKTFIRKIRQGDKIRYSEVWNERRGKKVIQHHVRYLGSDPNNLPEPSSFNIEKIHFGYLAQLILCDTLSTDDIYLMLDGMGKSVERKEIKDILIRYKLNEKKTRLHLVFPKKRKNDVQSVVEDSK
ncbi:MAG: hypothetical protein AEth_01648 [Candidatus Argoarchaeum ethanivorans]|uniref:Uncharacterized protein n=1 Tax=Candidatus Argoarchaeum ethanivorans TaxID=2608793 RepID=A0A8B3S019_9EURY|nr:MAG: hypothetical protein AEth_01648 [Candidatus Argoarchaeum ethanivorans]